jgi:hypothetical protein
MARTAPTEYKVINIIPDISDEERERRKKEAAIGIRRIIAQHEKRMKEST